MVTQAKAVFLDRDGVLNANIERDGRQVAPTTLEEFRLMPAVEEAARRLKHGGFMLIVVTNQPDVATGRTARATVGAMHAQLRKALPLDDIKVCYHVDTDGCDCRKPKPGMILQAAAERGIDLSRSIVVGDRWSDIQAGQRAGCFTILVDCGLKQEQPSAPDAVVGSLREAADVILDRGLGAGGNGYGIDD